jgi:hypothetical protein
MGSFRLPVFTRMLPLLVALTLLVLIAGAQAGNIRTDGVADTLPYYSRLEANEIFHDDQWTVIVFYRPAASVPADFNLLELWDEGALTGESMTVDGFIIWEELRTQPLLINLHGLGAVPVWFVSWNEMQAAATDGILTIGELAGLSSLKTGVAFNYQEMLQPNSPDRLGTIEYNAKGKLDDGTPFRVHALWAGTHDLNINIELE